MRRILAALALPAVLAGCAVYPDGSLGPLPPAGVYAPPPVAYGPPVYGYGEPPPVYYAPPPVVVSPSIGLGFHWGPRGYYGGRGWGRPYRRW